MEMIVDKMRSDFELVAQARKEAGEWTEADIREFNAAIKDCIKRNDTTALALWARWLADLSASVVFFNLVVKGTETAMRAAAAKSREGAK